MAKKRIGSGNPSGRRITKTKDGAKLAIKVRSSNLGASRKRVKQPRRRRNNSGKRGDKR